MAKTAWPTTTELTNRLTGLGVTTIPTGVVLQDEIDKAVAVLEQVSGQSPFLMEDSAGVFKYSPPSSDWLDLKGRWATITEVSVDGEVQVENTDYYLLPYDGPYRMIRFCGNLTGDPLTVSVTGKRGYSDTIPLDVWLAVLDYAAATVYETAQASGAVMTGPVSEIQQDSVKLKFAGGSMAEGASTANRLKDEAQRVFVSKRTLSVGHFV